ncbi:MAG: hypothetical protein WC748_04895 [Legionellales bacterium]|jgi:hypothetical protein
MPDLIKIPSENIENATSFVSTYCKNDEFISYCSEIEYQAYAKAKVLAYLKNWTGGDITLNEFGAGVLYAMNGTLIEISVKNSTPKRSYQRSKDRQNFTNDKQNFIANAKKGLIQSKSFDDRWFQKNKKFILAGIKEAIDEYAPKKQWNINLNAPAFRENVQAFHMDEIYPSESTSTNNSLPKITVNFEPLSSLYKNNTQAKKDYAKTLAKVFALYQKGQKFIKENKADIRNMHGDFKWKEFDKYNIGLTDLPEITDADLEFICLELELDYENDFKEAFVTTKKEIADSQFDDQAKKMFAAVSLAGFHHFSQKRNENSKSLNFKNPDDEQYIADESNKKGHPLVNEAFLDQSIFILLDITFFGEASKKGPVLYPKPENDPKDPSLQYINQGWEIVTGNRINFLLQKEDANTNAHENMSVEKTSNNLERKDPQNQGSSDDRISDLTRAFELVAGQLLFESFGKNESIDPYTVLQHTYLFMTWYKLGIRNISSSSVKLDSGELYYITTHQNTFLSSIHHAIRAIASNIPTQATELTLFIKELLFLIEDKATKDIPQVHFEKVTQLLDMHGSEHLRLTNDEMITLALRAESVIRKLEAQDIEKPSFDLESKKYTHPNLLPLFKMIANAAGRFADYVGNDSSSEMAIVQLTQRISLLIRQLLNQVYTEAEENKPLGVYKTLQHAYLFLRWYKEVIGHIPWELLQFRERKCQKKLTRLAKNQEKIGQKDILHELGEIQKELYFIKLHQNTFLDSMSNALKTIEEIPIVETHEKNFISALKGLINSSATDHHDVHFDKVRRLLNDDCHTHFNPTGNTFEWYKKASTQITALNNKDLSSEHFEIDINIRRLQPNLLPLFKVIARKAVCFADEAEDRVRFATCAVELKK